MEIATGILARDEYLRTIAQAVEFLRDVGVETVAVAYGWGCDCPDEQLYENREISLSGLLGFIREAEAADFYRVGKDNLHVKDSRGRAEFLFCHESDIHFLTEDAKLLEQLKSLWIASGFEEIHEKQGEGWRPVGSGPWRADA